MYIYSPSNGTNLGVMENAREVVVKITSDLGGFSGSFSIDDELKETFEVPGKAEGNVNLEVEEVELSPFEDTVSVDFSDETGTVEAASTDSSVATASVDGDQINITIQDNPQEDIDTSEDNLTSYDCHINLSLWWEDLFNGEHTITININADVTHGIPSDVATFTFTKTTEGTVIQRKWKKIGYKLNPVMDEIEPQQVILCDRQLHRICELEPVENLRYVLNELNKANEISFNYYKYVNNKHTNGFEKEKDPEKYTTCPGFDRLQDLSIVQVGNEYFEVAVTKSDDGSMKKSVSGISLGFAELSQLISTIAINTDEDLDEDFKPTIFYDETNQEHSLLHRILNDAAPHYQVGHVDDTLSKIQRTFSWENTDVISMLNEIGEEINCVFDIVVSRDTDGNATRIVNAYDLCYCKTCWDEVREQGQKAEGSADLYRNIVNGRCQHCEELGRNPYNLHDIGYITNVFLSTEHMANSITVNGNKDQIKNSFKVEGGDDFMTDAVEGLNMSSSNNITIFSPQTKKEMSIPLHNALDKYEADYKAMQPYYDKFIEIYWDVADIILYLKSGRMPVSDEIITDTAEALYDMLSKFASKEQGVGFNSIVYIDKKGIDGKGHGANFSANIAQNTLRKMLTLYLPKGFSLDVKAKDKSEAFNGTITIRKNVDSEDCITLEIGEGSNTISVGKTYSKQFPGYSDQAKQSFVESFKPIYMFAETYSETGKKWEVNQGAFANYIQQYCLLLIKNNNIEMYDNEKKRDWSKYSSERLKSYIDGYQECITKMTELIETSETPWGRDHCQKIANTYTNLLNGIQQQKSIIDDQIAALNMLYGPSYDEDGNEKWPDYMSDAKGSLSYTWKYYNKSTSYLTIIQELLDSTPSKYNGENYTPSKYIGDKPYKCKKCGSSNVGTEGGINVCLRKGCNGSGNDIYTYVDIVSDIVSFATSDIKQSPYIDYYTDYKQMTMTGIQRSVKEAFNLQNYLNPDGSTPNVLYNEMMSFIREDVYSNSNYSSEGLSNAELVQKATELRNKATRELAKACIPQYTLQMQLSSILALEPIEWQGKTMNADFKNFCINNYVHVQIDDDIYRLRIASIELVYPMNDTVTVTFTDASRYLGGGMSDIASIIAQAQSMATSYNYTADQAEKGVIANNIFQTIYNSGMDSALMNVTAARNQDIVIDQHGILLREMNEYTDEYSPFQMKLINRNIVMTSTNWRTADLAIGLARLGVDRDEYGMPWNENSKEYGRTLTHHADDLVYGVWADVLCGSLIAGENLVISNKDTNVFIGEHGIAIQGGWLDVGKGTERVIIDPLLESPYNKTSNTKYIMYALSGNGKGTTSKTESDGGVVFSVDNNGNAFFAGKIWARSGHIANWDIDEKGLTNRNNDAYIYTGSHASFNSKSEGFYLANDGLSIGSNFSVNGETGELSATDGFFSGTINADNGYIGNWEIKDGQIHGKNNDACIYTGNHNGLGGDAQKQPGFYLSMWGLGIGQYFWVNEVGTTYIQEGYFGPLIAIKGRDENNTDAYVHMMENGITNFCLSKEGMFLGGTANVYIGFRYQFYDMRNKAEYKGGTIIHSDGSIQVDSLNIMNKNSRAIIPQPLPTNATGVHCDITQGSYPSKTTSNTKYYPLQLKFTGCDNNNNEIPESMIGIWQEGRMIVGKYDHKGKTYAYKASIHGDLFVRGDIFCDFDTNNGGITGTRFKLLKPVKLSDYIEKKYLTDEGKKAWIVPAEKLEAGKYI